MKKALYTICLLITCISCEDVIDVDLNNSDPKLVINASFNVSEIGEQTQATVELSLTRPFFEDEDTFVNDAEVKIINGDGIVTAIDLLENGTYSALLVIDPEKEYTLEVIYNGETYTATEQFVPVVEFESIEQENDAGFSGDEIELKAFFTDPAGIDNFYYVQYFSEEERDQDVFSDEFFDGNTIFAFISSDSLEPGDEITLLLNGVNEQFYNFGFVLLQQGSDDSGGPFETQPATVRGNIINTTNPDNFPLGYFRISQQTKLIYTIQ